jgi:hypothetical protein
MTPTPKEKKWGEAIEIYFAIKQVMAKQKTDYCQSWWLNTRNFDLKSNLPTRKITQRCKLLIQHGYLTINEELTSTSKGTSYKLTDKPLVL